MAYYIDKEIYEFRVRCSSALPPTEGLAYTLSDDGTYYIFSGYGTATDKNVVIASEIDGIPVKAIGASAFLSTSTLNKYDIVRLIIPDSITTFLTNLGFTSTLVDYSSLTSFAWPLRLPAIPFAFFGNCNKLKSIYIPSTLKEIGWAAFPTALTDIYYGGTREQWAKVDLGISGIEGLQGATIHYNDNW